MNVQNALAIGGEQSRQFSTSLSSELVVGQQRSIDIADVFQFEMRPVSPALIDEYGCLRQGDKAVFVKSLSVSVTAPCAPNVVLVDAGHLLYHVIWPVSGTTGYLAAIFGIRLAHYPPVSKKFVLFDRYDQEAPSAKYPERTREEEPRKYVKPQTPPSMPRSYPSQFQEQESASQHPVQLSPSAQHPTRKHGGKCRYP